MNIGEKACCQPIESQNSNKAVEQHFIETCHQVEQSQYYRMKLCFENAASLMIDEPPTNLHKCIAEFIERMIDAFMPLGILNSTGLSDGRKVLNEIRQSLNQPNSASKTKYIIEKSNEFYKMIPHIEFNFDQPKKLPPINTPELCRNKTELLHHLEAVTEAIQTGRQMENRNPLEFIYNNFMNVEIKPILNDHSDYGAFIDDFCIEDSQPIKFLFSVRNRNETTASTDQNNTSENVHYLFHSTQLSNLIDILRDGLRVAPNHVFSYNRWYGRGIYFYGDFNAARDHADRLKQKIVLVCRVALGNVEILEQSDAKYTNPNSLYPLQNDKNSLRAFGRLARSTFKFNENYRAFLPSKREAIVKPFEMLQIVSKWRYGHEDEFVVQHENQVKIEYILELND